MERVKLLCNGFPKHGNHPLVKACQLLGQPCAVSHIPFGGESPEHTHHIFIKRDPRNAIVAWLRMQGSPETPGMFISAFRFFQNAMLVEEMSAFEGWLNDPDTFVVTYEALIKSPAEMQSIAKYLGIPYLKGSWENLPGLTKTWTGPNHSDYRKIWVPEVKKVWAAEGGKELLKRWGYA